MRTTPEFDLPAAAPLPPRRDGSRVDALALHVTRMAAGDQAALGEVYDATAQRVHALACRMLGKSHIRGALREMRRALEGANGH